MAATSEAIKGNPSSTWKRGAKSKSSSSQTEPIKVSEGVMQCPDMVSMSTQCSLGRKYGKADESTINLSELAQFLKRSMPLCEKEIRKSEDQAKAWLNLERSWQASDRKPEAIRQFSSDHVLTIQDSDKIKANYKYSVSCITWNCNGSVLIVAYSAAKQHQEWCSHESLLFIWNLYRTYERKSKPTNVLDIEAGCVTVLQAHPKAPSVFAVGTVSGKVLILNSRYTGSGAAGESYIRSSNAHLTHQDAVSVIHWSKGDQGHDQLVSMGLDGRIYLWKMNNENKSQLQAVKVFVITVQNMPRTLGIKSSANLDSLVGITSASFSSEDPAAFIVGCHGGAIFQCSLLSTTPAPVHSSRELSVVDHQLFSPLVNTFAPHRGHIISVEFSPLLRNVFLSSAADGELRIYSLLNTKPLVLIHCPTGLSRAAWSTVRQSAVYVLQADGLISVYNVTIASQITKPSLIVSLDTPSRVVYFQPNTVDNNDEIVIYTENGNVTLWNFKRIFPASFDKQLAPLLHAAQDDSNV
ncbi:Dynein axonemal intermediate chain 2 [Halotydeus destructor]|nr:Dynein axonemal intermediate chain 2 [Halotydeus destructor]